MVSVNAALHRRPGQQPALHLHEEVTLGWLKDLQAGPAGAVHCRKATKATQLGLPTRTAYEHCLTVSVKSPMKNNVLFQCSAISHAKSSTGAHWLWSKEQGGGIHQELAVRAPETVWLVG